MPPPGGQRAPWQHGEHLGHLVQVADLDGAVRAEHRREHARLAGEAAGVARDRAARALAAADLEDHDRLAAIGGAVERGDEPLGLRARVSRNIAMTRVAGSSMRYSR